MNSSFVQPDFDDSGWRQLNLPHDGAEELPLGKTLWLEFDGVYRNSLVWLNGHCLGRNTSGYSSFYFDITPYANYGGKNTIAVRVDASKFEGWCYEGAGSYRHVWLVKTAPVHIAHDGIFVYSQFKNNVPGGPADIHAKAQLDPIPAGDGNVSVSFEIVDPDGFPHAWQARRLRLMSVPRTRDYSFLDALQYSRLPSSI